MKPLEIADANEHADPSTLDKSGDDDAINTASEKEQSLISNDNSPVVAIPAATPVERGRFVLDLHNRDLDSDEDEQDDEEQQFGQAKDSHCQEMSKTKHHDASSGSAVENGDSSNNSFLSDDDVFGNEADKEGNGEDGRIRDEDLDRLLGPLPQLRSNNSKSSHLARGVEAGHDDHEGQRKRKKQICFCCPRALRNGPFVWCHGSSNALVRMGNMIVVFPRCFGKIGFGVVGPHWFGPICCFALLSGASFYYVPAAYHNVGPLTALVCILFYVVGTFSLLLVSCTDPGIVKTVRGGGPDGKGGIDGVGVGRNGYMGVPMQDLGGGARDLKNWRYCDLCSVYQPPNAVHCPDCNVCIEGYDHHCPWMGTCIGKGNFKPFLIFNLTWLFYMFYSITWVTFFGPAMFGKLHAS